MSLRATCYPLKTRCGGDDTQMLVPREEQVGNGRSSIGPGRRGHRVRDLGLEVRAGLHTGECELLADDDIDGLAIHLGPRIRSLAGPGEVLVSSTVCDLIVGSGQILDDRGEHQLKGIPDRGRCSRSGHK